jgi:uncharacterized protein YktB (UPF0637 family)
MEFSGFAQEDFDIFTIEGFAARMAEIRARLRPKLVALGEALREDVAAIAGEEICAHAAAHMRRTVNAPPETWAAFGRSARGYKRFVHYRAAVSAEGVRITVFVEDDADDKPILAEALRRDAAGLLARLGNDARLLWYTAPTPDGAPLAGNRITVTAAQAIGATLATRKLAKFQAGIPLGRDVALVGDPERFCAAALQAMRQLAPLYRAANPAK